MIIGSFGFGGHSWMSEQFRDKLAIMGHTLKTMHEYPSADVKYSKEGIKAFIDSCDVIILPSRPSQPAKSVNRLVLAWSRSKPCVVSPLDAYLRVGIDGEDFLVAKEYDDFCPCIDKLSKDTELMQKLAKNGFKKAMLDEKSYNTMNYSKKYLLEIRKHLMPKIHVAIPHYLPRTDYLYLAVESVLQSVDVDVIVSIASSSPSKLSFKDPRVKVYQQKENMPFSKATNKAIECIDSDASYVLLLNDDTIVSKHSLKRMVEVSKLTGNAIVNPLSNCDRGWLHNFDLKIHDKSLVPNMHIENFNKDEILILQNTQYADPPKFIESAFAAFYSTLIPIEVFNKVGKLNEGFANGGEDLDFCNRAKRFGVKVGWAPNAFVFHFGGKSRKLSHETRGVDHELEDQVNNTLVQKMWGRDGQKKRVAIYTGPAWEKWSIETPYTTGIGGSETCAIRLAEQMVQAGHNITLYGEHDNHECNGIILKHWTNFKPEEEYWDLFIASRSLDSINNNLRAKKIVVWTHDVFIQGVRNIPNDKDRLIDKYIVLSDWHKEFFKSYHTGFNHDKLVTIPNGVDSDLFK